MKICENAQKPRFKLNAIYPGDPDQFQQNKKYLLECN